MGVDSPVRQLAHRTGSGESTGGSWSTYALYPIPVTRPEAGRVVEVLVCGECGAEVACAVTGAAGVRRLRLWWRGLATVPGAFAVVLVVPVAGAQSSGQAVAFAVLGVALLPVLAFGVHLALRRARDEDGLRLVRGDGIHSLRPAGSTSDFSATLEA
ncbi:hypothetical protein [Dactylosporangium sp. CA-233914]|uniref:hypothetical protein n=1 Tax=Dactylosporangium sp. CA-233914 TaxID=3239934 RepID=UPI003D8ABC68